MSVIHSRWALLGCRAALRRGTARYSTLRSMEISSAGRANTASPIHSRRLARGAASGACLVFFFSLALIDPPYYMHIKLGLLAGYKRMLSREDRSTPANRLLDLLVHIAL